MTYVWILLAVAGMASWVRVVIPWRRSLEKQRSLLAQSEANLVRMDELTAAMDRAYAERRFDDMRVLESCFDELRETEQALIAEGLALACDSGQYFVWAMGSAAVIIISAVMLTID